MRLTVLFLFATAALSACNDDPCDGEVGSCISAKIEGAAPGLNQLVISADRPTPMTRRTPDPSREITLPASVAIVFPAGTLGNVLVHIDGLSNTTVIASTEQVVEIPAGGRASATFVLSTPTGDGGGSDGSADGGGCANGDQVCPSGCNANNDTDCSAICGNGVIESGEVCDDNNTNNGDACDPTCQFRNVVTLVSGKPAGAGWADGIGQEARFAQPNALASDLQKIYVGDSCTIRELDPFTKTVTTIVGAHHECMALDGTGTAARLVATTDLEFIPDGNKGTLYVTGGNSLRKIDLATKAVTTVGGVVADETGAGTDGTTLFLASQTNGLRSVNLSTGAVTPIASFVQLGNRICTDVVSFAGDLYVACDGSTIVKVTPGNPPAVAVFAGGTTGCADHMTDAKQAQFTGLNRIVIDSLGTIHGLDSGCHVTRTISPTAVISNAGQLGVSGHADDSNPKMSTFNGPQALVRSVNSLFIADTDNHAIRTVVFGMQSVLAGVLPPDQTIKLGFNPRWYLPAGVIPLGDSVLLSTFSLGGPSQTAKVNLTSGFAETFYSAGIGGPVLGDSLYSPVADGTIWRFPLDGSAPSHFAGKANQPNGTPITNGPKDVAVIFPTSMCTDGKDLFFLERIQTIRKVDIAAGDIQALVGTVGTVDVVDGQGSQAHLANAGGCTVAGQSIYFLDGTDSAGGAALRRLELATKTVTTIAGKPDEYGYVDAVGTNARFGRLSGLATDGRSLFLTDAGNGASVNSGLGDPNGPTIRQLVLATAAVTTMAGSRGAWTFRSGAGLNAGLNFPVSIAFDSVHRDLLLIDLEEGLLLRLR